MRKHFYSIDISDLLFHEKSSVFRSCIYKGTPRIFNADIIDIQTIRRKNEKSYRVIRSDMASHSKKYSEVE